jgi:uncharacterized protein YcaQ
LRNRGIASLRAHAITQSLFKPTTLQAAIDRLGFVQADPIRSPARAQDLILRHRTIDYRAGDLERQYASLDVEEDYLYAYRFLSRRVSCLLHPRKTPALRTLEGKVLETVRRLGEARPGGLDALFGKRRMTNAWGGYSKATTDALEWLHWRGLLRVARRDQGIRVYRPASPLGEAAAPADRLRVLIMVLAHIFAPSLEKSLQAVIARYGDLGSPRRALGTLIHEGALTRETVGDMSYVWPSGDPSPPDAPRVVRLLAPFDPLVWDRTRFEHLWGWAYRFEAYTPVAKRIRGYYAMPLLWGAEVVGWGNVMGASAGGRSAKEGTSAPKRLDVHIGYVQRRPRGREFTRELDAEIARLEWFLRHNACI